MNDSVVVLALDELGESDREALTELASRAEAADDHPALPDPQRRAVGPPTSRGPGVSDDVQGYVALARRDEVLVGAGVVSLGRDASAALHLVLDPAPRRRPAEAKLLTDRLVESALGVVPPGSSVDLWVMKAGPDDDARATALGFRTERDVVQMRVALPLPANIVAGTRPLETRAFVPGRDEVAWVETNNRAFATHPEQGNWTVAELQSRLRSDWVDLDGFLVADDPDRPGLIGSCWTKLHRETAPVLGEIYVIAVDPRHHGQGWGRSLTVAGLEYLARRSVRHGMLYTEGDNRTAFGLYTSLGFTLDHVDRAYRFVGPTNTVTVTDLS